MGLIDSVKGLFTSAPKVEPVPPAGCIIDPLENSNYVGPSMYYGNPNPDYKEMGLNGHTIITNIVECQGCFWHGCSICKKTITLGVLKTIEKDKKRRISFDEKGFKLVELWEHELSEETNCPDGLKRLGRCLGVEAQQAL